jgi:hypothetical protein
MEMTEEFLHGLVVHLFNSETVEVRDKEDNDKLIEISFKRPFKRISYMTGLVTYYDFVMFINIILIFRKKEWESNFQMIFRHPKRFYYYHVNVRNVE